MKTILIAGAAGFLGSHLSRYYINQGDSVFGVDNLSTGNKVNLVDLMSNPNFSFIEHDICQPLPLEIRNSALEIIFNLACPASPPKYQKLAQETLQVSSVGLGRLIDLAQQKKARLVQASTSEVYGDPSVDPQPEEYWGNVNSYGPRSMYDEGKRFGEALIWTAQNSQSSGSKLNAGIARIFNTYGPNMAADDGRVVSNLIVEALKGQPLTLHGDGNQTRSFCYISDLIAGLVALADSTEQTPINIGNPNEFTIVQLAEKILDLTDSRSEVTFINRPVDDPSQRRPDITKAKNILGWEPKIELDEGLKLTIDYFLTVDHILDTK